MHTLILIDGRNSVYRFGFAHAQLTNSANKASGAIFGVLGALVRLKRRYPDGQIVVVWDGRGKSWRHKFWSGYKSNRLKASEKPPEVVRVLEQEAPVKAVLNLLHIPQVEVEGVEADDLIGMAAIMHRVFGNRAVVYSSDRDFMQLMQAGVTIIRPQPFAKDRKDSFAEETDKDVMKRFGVGPDDLLKLRAYAGDKSDGIPPAIPGIGEKRALICLKAGADPSKDDLPKCEDLKLQFRLRAAWGDVRRNYRLMQIAAFPDPALFGHRTVKSIKIALDGAGRDLSAVREGKASGYDYDAYKRFLGFLLDWDLLEALEYRHKLWSIQHVRQ